jgi:hypothetical protein
MSFHAISHRWPALATAAVAALVVAGAVFAANPSKEKIALTGAGNARAKVEVLLRSDLGKGWSGGFKKPDLAAALPCSNYRPKQSDLVLIGAAETAWDKQAAAEIDSEAQVLRTADMVRRDWLRTVLAPQVLPCLRQGFKRSLGKAAKLVSFRRVAFPRVAAYTAAFRLVANVTTPSGSVPLEVDLVAMGAGRNELTLTASGLAAAKVSLRATELRLARVLARRGRQ